MEDEKYYKLFSQKMLGKIIFSLEKELKKEIVSWFLNEKKGFVTRVDSGYDFSSFGNTGVLPFSILDYETVDDFLNETTGNSVPTYLSGSGMVAETFDMQLDSSFNQQMSAYESDIVLSMEKEFKEDFSEYDFFDDECWLKAREILENLKESNLTDIMGDVPDIHQHSYWKKATELIKNLSLKEELFLTINGYGQIGTFSFDNWNYLLDFWNQLIHNHLPEEPVSLVIRQFSKIKIENIPMKRVAGAILYPEEIRGLSAKEIQEAFTTDHETGKKIQINDNIKYCSLDDLLKILGIESF